MGTFPTRAVTAIIVVTIGLGAGRATAEDLAPPASGPRVDEAQSRFRRGVELYAEGDYSGALVELTRAYELAPNFRILFNLGQMSYQRRNYAAALDYLTRYLNQGGDQIPASRRMQVEADLDQLRQRVGYVGIEMAARGFDVVIDDLVVGATPLAAPVTVNVGHHRVALVNPSGDQQVRVIDLPGRQTVWLKFKPPVPPLDERTAIAALADHRPDAGSAPEEAASPLRAARSAKPRDNQSDELDAAHRRGLWLSWTLTAIVAGSAAVTGALALSTSLELERKLDSYPASPTELDDLRTRKHQLALATDGLLIGTTILSALSLYLTFSGPSRAEHDGPSQLSFAKF